jgi:amidophosphoribosyltransferase
MCGIVGIFSNSDVNQSLYQALTVLQHRGQDAAGIATYDNGTFRLHKSTGLVRDVFHTRHMRQLIGTMGIGHVRYPTAGSISTAEAQPFYVNSPYGIALIHNGNLTNTAEISRNLFAADLRHLNTGSDSEALLNVFAQELQNLGKFEPSPNDIFTAVSGVLHRCFGGYAVVAMINGYGMVGFRDPNGIRPIVYGRRETRQGTEYMIASESAALDVLGFSQIHDIAPGEAVYVDMGGRLHKRRCADNPNLVPCIFEYVYFARPDSIMNGISVYKSRLHMGRKLADKILRIRPKHDIEVVIPIPDTSRTCALQLAGRLGVKYREGFIKNRFIGRTFIMPGQCRREKSVRRKLNPISLELKDKNVLLVDDSIVRGTTSRQIIQMARDAGAKKVYFASAAPPVRYPNIYGIDMPTAGELIAHSRTENEVEKLIGADWLIYQDLEDLIASAAEENPDIAEFDCSVFNGNYIAGDINQAYLRNLEKTRYSEKQNTDDCNFQDVDERSAIDIQNYL